MSVTNTQDAAGMKSRIVDAALVCAARDPWLDVTMRRIAEEADVPLALLMELFEDKADIVAAYGHRLDREVAEAVNGQSLENDTEKDRLFDVMMERFDLMNDHRAAVISMMDATTSEPKQLVMAMPHLCRSVTRMMELCDIPTGGWPGAARIGALSVLYAKVLRDWVGDESEDMSVTMASMDKALTRAGQFAGLLNFH